MKKTVKMLAAVLFAAVLCISGGMSAYAMGLFQWNIEIDYTNAPEGTAFADLLFPKLEDDMYLPDENAKDYYMRSVCSYVRLDRTDGNGYTVSSRNIKLDKDCGLAVYDDGFTSCMMRRYFVGSCTVTDRKNIRLSFPQPCNAENKSVFEYYGSFRVAYCDEEGNVLLVTEPVKIKPYKHNCVYEISADGGRAEYRIHKDGTRLLIFLIKVAVILIPFAVLSGIMAVVFGVIRGKNKNEAPEGASRQ